MNLVEILFSDDERELARIEAMNFIDTPSYVSVEASEKVVGMLVLSGSSAEVQEIKNQISSSHAGGSASPVTAAHLESLGIFDAILNWSIE